MIFHLVATGEGATDIGASRDGLGISVGEDFLHGPMYRLFLMLLERTLPEWNQGQEFTHTFVYRKELGQRAKASKVRLPSKDKALKGHLEHAKRAAALAEITKELYPNSWTQSLSVYFHDCDGTRSELDEEPEMQLNRANSVLSGFKAADYENGVAMIPKPTSEAWIICSVKDEPYSHCQLLETTLSGNDRSPQRAPKNVLANFINNENYNRDDLNNLIQDIEVEKLCDMPSFRQFKEHIKTVVLNTCGALGQEI